MNIISYETLDSTNEEAKRLAVNGKHEYTIIIAKNQTAGKGRTGKQWHSSSGNGLYMSMILPAHNNPLRVTIDAGITLADVLNAKIKWTNDIIYNQKKISGILAESIVVQNNSGNIERFIILGIGVNLLNESFPDELSDKATSIFIETGKRIDPYFLAQDIYDAFLKYNNTDFGKILAAYKQKCITLHKDVSFCLDGKTYSGYAEDIDSSGGLIVKTDNDTFTLRSGEVSVRGLSGDYL